MPSVMCDGCQKSGPVVISRPKWRRIPMAIIDGWGRDPNGDHWPRDQDYTEARQRVLDLGWTSDMRHPGHDWCPECQR